MAEVVDFPNCCGGAIGYDFGTFATEAISRQTIKTFIAKIERYYTNKGFVLVTLAEAVVDENFYGKVHQFKFEPLLLENGFIRLGPETSNPNMTHKTRLRLYGKFQSVIPKEKEVSIGQSTNTV